MLIDANQQNCVFIAYFNWSLVVKCHNFIKRVTAKFAALEAAFCIKQLVSVQQINRGSFNAKCGFCVSKSMCQNVYCWFVTFFTDFGDTRSNCAFVIVATKMKRTIVDSLANIENFIGARVNVEINVMPKFLADD